MRDLTGKKGGQWLTRKTAAIVLGAVAALELTLMAALTVTSILGRYSSFSYLLPALILDYVILFSAMHRHMTYVHTGSQRFKAIWNLALLYAILIGPIIYYHFVYLPDARAAWRST